eukprot:750104-Hanusia_phi.AAC.1
MMSCLEKLRPRKDLSKFFDLWQTRFFVLVDKQLKYFKRYENFSNGEDPLGQISLERAWLIEQESNSPSKKKIIAIRTPWRDFSLRTDQERIFENWMKAFDSIGLIRCTRDQPCLKEEWSKETLKNANSKVTLTTVLAPNGDHRGLNDKIEGGICSDAEIPEGEHGSPCSEGNGFSRSDDIIGCSLYLANEIELVPSKIEMACKETSSQNIPEIGRAANCTSAASNRFPSPEGYAQCQTKSNVKESLSKSGSKTHGSPGVMGGEAIPQFEIDGTDQVNRRVKSCGAFAAATFASPAASSSSSSA